MNKIWRCDLKSPCVKFCESKNDKDLCGINRRNIMKKNKVFKEHFVRIGSSSGFIVQTKEWLGITRINYHLWFKGKIYSYKSRKRLFADIRKWNKIIKDKR